MTIAQTIKLAFAHADRGDTSAARRLLTAAHRGSMSAKARNAYSEALDKIQAQEDLVGSLTIG